MKNKNDIRSEEGAASVLEATIVFPLVFLVVIFLIFMGFTYLQRGVLNFHASQLSNYISKVICYPGYEYIEQPFYEKKHDVTLNDIKKAMDAQAPYRYLFGLFGTEYSAPTDSNGRELIKTCAEKMAKEYLSEHTIIKAAKGSVSVPSSLDSGTVIEQNGYICAISDNTSRVTVFLGQNFIFADFFKMIGVGGKSMVISAQSTSFVSDSLEIVRLTDMAFDLTNFAMRKLGINTEQIDHIKEMIAKVTNNR